METEVTQVSHDGGRVLTQGGNTESISKVLYKFQRIANKHYLRINSAFPDASLLKEELNSTIGDANYSEFYWKWKALAFSNVCSLQ